MRKRRKYEMGRSRKDERKMGIKRRYMLAEKIETRAKYIRGD
jgi:hypothetical protein